MNIQITLGKLKVKTAALFLILSILFITAELESQSTISFGTVVTALDTTSTGIVNGSSYALPSASAQVLTWQTILTGGPSAVSISFQGSLDNTNWQNIATATTPTGQVYTAGPVAFKFVRAVQNSRTGGTNTQVLLSVGRGYDNTSSSMTAGRFGFADGSVTNPSIYSATEPNTGMYYDSANDAWYTVILGTSRFAVSNGGVTSFASFTPQPDNLRDLGTSGARWKDIYLGGTLYTGAGNTTINPSGNIFAQGGVVSIGASNLAATVGNIRLPHGGTVIARNNANNNDQTILSYGTLSTDNTAVGTSGGPTRIRSNLSTPGGTLSDGEWWVQCTGTSPSRVCSIQVRDGGVTRTIASTTF